MMTKKFYLGVALCLSLAFISCKSVNPRSLESASAEARTKVNRDDVSAPYPSEWQEIRKDAVEVDQFVLQSVPSKGIEEHMTPGSSVQNIPESLQGIWWMDGNSLAPGNVMTFAHLAWDFPHHRALVTEYGVGNYTFDDSPKGRASFESSVSTRLCFTFVFNEDYTFGQLYQSMDLPRSNVVVKVPKLIVNYTMNLESDGAWLRKSKWGPVHVPNYTLRRIVDADGKRIEPAYSNWLKIAPPMSLVVQSRKVPAKAP